MALLELYAELESLVLRLKVEDERLRTLRPRLFFPPLAPRFIARQPTLHNALRHLQHLFLGRLSRNLQQQRLRRDPVLDALSPQGLRNVPQRESLRHARTRTTNLSGHILVRVFESRRQLM